MSIGLGAAPKNLDFTQTAGAAIPQALMYNVYESLVKVDGEGKIQPLLAKSWTISPDRKTYDFVLEPSAKFSNGDAFTADDVKFSLERIKSWKANTPKNLAAIDHVDVVSPTEAKVVLSKPDNNVLFWLAGPLGAMFTPNGVSDLANKAVGTGPYTVDSYSTDESLVMKRNDSYWGKKPGVSGVTLKYYVDANAPTNALRSGEIDVVYQAQALDQVKSFESDKSFTVNVGTTQGIIYMSMNPTRAPFTDIRVRQAIEYGIDKKEVNTTVTNGYGKITGEPVPSTDPWAEDKSSVYPYDPEKAKQLLADSGHSNMTVQFNVPSLPYSQSIGQVVKSELAKIGVTVNLVTQEFPAVWLQNTFTQADYQMTVINHVEPRSFTNYADSTYYWRLSDPAVNDAIASAASAPSDDEYVAGMRKAVDAVVAAAPGDWLYNAPNVVLEKTGIDGISKNDTGVALDLTSLSRS
ncbi:ABC transporter substrate-binding protein [Gordonia jinhuaensis]|uniref:Peptide ABC transporter substrate-binding protein n=1 Tax=Gordonia jinhuaensis TaxID=1517702 RepID=A0A916WW10_9ACTN|nr:peptide ABC transporter substrate-binding protein [Gordonia jinhuaensis]